MGISRETIRLNVMDIYRRCMTAKPVMKYDPDRREWVESGEFVFDSKGALKAMELLGKPLGMFERDKDGNLISAYPDAKNHHIDAVRYGMQPVWKQRGE